MTTEAIAASLPRPESDLDGSSSYVPSLVSPTERDSLDEGYDPDETLKVTVYDNEQIQFKSSGMFYEDVSSTESESEDDLVVPRGYRMNIFSQSIKTTFFETFPVFV